VIDSEEMGKSNLKIEFNSKKCGYDPCRTQVVNRELSKIKKPFGYLTVKGVMSRE